MRTVTEILVVFVLLTLIVGTPIVISAIGEAESESVLRTDTVIAKRIVVESESHVIVLDPKTDAGVPGIWVCGKGKQSPTIALYIDNNGAPVVGVYEKGVTDMAAALYSSHGDGTIQLRSVGKFSFVAE